MSTIKAKKTDTQIETNLRRRTAYGEMPSEQKAARLERRRLQYAVKRQTTLENSTTTTSKESSSSLEPCSIVLHQHTLYMRDKPLASRNASFALHMALRSRIDLITTDTPDWTCKLVLLYTYLISAARVKDLPKSYGRPIHTYYWILDKETIVERINLNDEIEKPLPQPNKLNLTHLANVAQLIPTSSAKIGLSLQTKFNTTIRIDPSYPKALELLDWCIFQIDLTDVTGSMIALISGELSEKMLSMTTEDIFDTTCVKMQLLRLDHIHQILSNKSFNIQLKKSSWKKSIDQRIAKKAKPLATSNREMEPTIVEFGSSSETLELEPLTPAK
ncbi:hypothetical protein FXO38_30674 [Capsicum annuum]|nr:hypothetical protein FXO38_30674 [Capsicum annuum]